MRAYTEYRDIWKQRIILSPENEKKLMERYKIARPTLMASLDLNNPNNTRPKMLDIQVDAINEFNGHIQPVQVRRKVLVIDRESSPKDFPDIGRKNIFH